MTAHATPRPWAAMNHAEFADRHPYAAPICDLNKWVVCTEDGSEPSAHDEIDAALIVRAVNSHDELLTALKRYHALTDSSIEGFEVIGEEFYKATRFLRPGKSEAMALYYEGREEERQAAWNSWITRQWDEAREAARAAIARAEGGGE